MNKAILIGNVGNITELKHVGETQVINLSLATRENNDSVSWHRCTAFGKTAETLSKYTSKGDRLAIEGKIQYREYEKDGEKRTSTDIVINAFEFLTSKKEKEQAEEFSSPLSP
jgi:single-strand DNA-binding protein